jgi:tannase/feruloyl esterase
MRTHASTTWWILLTLTIGTLVPASSAMAVTASDCTVANVAAMAPADTTITGASLTAAAGAIPEYCKVDGYVATPGNTVPFRLGLPTTAWNGKFLFIGVGGFAGQIGSLNAGLVRGYATASTDTGHQTARNTDAAWALDNRPKEIDYGHRGTHVTTVAAKSVTQSFYASALQQAYFSGCSNGGRQALMEVQRYPGDFTGVIAGDPSFGVGGQLNRVWHYQSLLSDPAHFIPNGKIHTISAATVSGCDAKDGLADGLIDDPRRCTFDPASLLCPGADADTCLTAPQVESLKKIYAGPSNSAGQISPGFPVGHEELSTGWQSWIIGTVAQTPAPQPDGHLLFGASRPSGFAYMDGFVRYLAFDVDDPTYSFFNFNFETDLPLLTTMEAILSPSDPDLTPFKGLGGKLIVYHGWPDPALSAYATVGYYGDVVKSIGGKGATDDFLRLFMVPGMHHCSGGPGPNTFDTLTALEQWVEHGAAPSHVVASHTTSGVVDRTRPLCPYPQVARYTGTGSIDDAANFACTTPTQALRDATLAAGIGGLQGGTLIKSLDKALERIAAGEAAGGRKGAQDLWKAQEWLGKFSNELEQMARIGKVSPGVAEPLVADAALIIEELAGFISP